VKHTLGRRRNSSSNNNNKKANPHSSILLRYFLLEVYHTTVLLLLWKKRKNKIFKKMCVSGEQELYSQLCSVSLSGISLSDDNNNKLRTFPSQREESSKRIWNERMLFYLSNSRSSSSIFL